MKQKKISFVVLIIVTLSYTSCQDKQKTNWDLLTDKFPVDTPLVFGQGIISTDNFEFAITFSPEIDELFFTRRKPGENNKIYRMKLVDNKWSEPTIASFSNSEMDFEPHISPNGKHLYFGSIRPIDDKQVFLRQWYLEKNNGEWINPKPLNASFTQDKMLMYLTSTLDETIYYTIIRSDPSGLFYSKKVDNKYDSYTRLNENVNQESAHPYIAPDESYLIYDCEKKDGFGSCDLYISFKKENGEWSKSINLGDLINTDQCEMCASVSPDGKYLFFHRGNEDFGNIYWFDFQKLLKELKN